MRIQIQIYCTIFLLFWSIKSSLGQYNLKVGFGSNYMISSEFETLVNDFNLEYKDILEEEMRPLTLMSGVHLGVRRKMRTWAYEISWQYLASKQLAYGEDDGALFEKQLFYTIFDNYLGLEYASNSFLSYGFTGGARFFRIKRNIDNSKLKKDLTKDSNPQFTGKVYLQFDLGGTNFTRFALRPYFEYAFTKIDLNPLRTDLGLLSLDSATSNFNAIGLTLLFYNGPQK